MGMEKTRTTRKITKWTPYETRPGRRRPKEDEDYWLEGEDRG
jgi:hypothetical protein